MEGTMQRRTPPCAVVSAEESKLLAEAKLFVEAAEKGASKG